MLHSLMPGFIFHAVGFTFTVRINQLVNHKAIIVHAVCFCNSERISLNRLDGAPHVDDLDSVLEKMFSLIWEVVWDA